MATGSVASGTGLVSGINYEDMITKMRAADSQPVYQIQASEQKIQQQQQSMQSINKAVTDFMTKAQQLSDGSGFLSMSATSDDASILLAGASNTASTGEYSVTVKQLAQASQIAGQGIATIDKTSIADSGGSFKFKVGNGATTSIDLTPGMTLQQLRDAINNASDSGVRASIVNDGTPTNPYRLVLTSSATGVDNAITIAQNDTKLNLTGTTIEDAVAGKYNAFNGTVTSSGTYTGSAPKSIMMQITTGGAVGTAKYKASYDGGVTWTANDAFTTSASDVDVTGAAAEGVNIKFADAGSNPVSFAVGDRFSVDTFVPQLKKAQDAIVEVDGIQVSRSTNTFNDVIEGVALTVKKVDSAPQTVRVTNSSGNVQGKLTDFVNSYNALVDTISKETAYDITKQTAAPLFGDSGVTSLLSQLRQIVVGAVPGAGAYSTLSSVGASIDKDGHLKLDSSKLSTALSKNLDAVKKLFVDSGDSSSTSIQYTSSTSDTRIGSHNISITTAAQQATVSGGRALEASGLAADESLTFSYGDKALTIGLTAGQNLDSVIATLNEKFGSNSMAVQASNDGGKLKISSVAYGGEEVLTVYSNRDAAAAGQLGIGTSTVTGKGVDVVGTIDGVLGTGSGQSLKGADGSTAKGLVLNITANSPISGSININHGIAISTYRQTLALTDSTTGLFTTRTNSYNTQLKDYDKRITDLQSRLDTEEQTMRSKFSALESKLSSIQSQGNFLMSQLASMIGTSSSK